MRHLVGSSLLSGLGAALLIGCSLSTVGAMDPVEGGKCEVSMQSKTANDGCTQCVCNGKTWDCDGSACAAGCSAGDKKLADDGCNTCSCGTSGTWICTTNQECPTPNPMQKCQPGDTKLRDDGCARCDCTSSGEWACPDIACAKCTPGELTMSDCLSCTCNADGTSWNCTGAAADGTCKPTPVCKPGETMTGAEMTCKTCTCSDDGTQWNCLPTMGNGCGGAECMPGQVTPSSDGCNTCSCTTDGKLVCTQKACDPCPAPKMASETCPAEMLFAQNPMTKACCAYGSKCEAPDGWLLYSTPDCSSGMPNVCSGGYADCDGDPTDGCETNLMNSPLDCGGCGMVCTDAKGTPGLGKCTLGKCETPPGQTCLYGGVVHGLGEMFPARDGCNYCACISDKDSTAVLSCTENACSCAPSKEPYRNYVATDAMKCQVLDFMCPEYTTMFANDCGCGCEQSTDCPDVFDCTTDPMTMKSNCDTALEARCPYSTATHLGLK